MDYRSAVHPGSEQSASLKHRQRSTQELNPYDDLMEYLRAYTRERPEVVALTCLGIGFILGWKLKPW
jgi:hypothetical protein